MNRLLNLFSVILYDMFASVISVLLSFYFLNQEIDLVWLKPFTFVLIVWPFVLTFCLYLVNIYKILWRFSGFEEIFRIIFGGKKKKKK